MGAAATVSVSTDPRPSAHDGDAAQALYFGDLACPLFGWLHPARRVPGQGAEPAPRPASPPLAVLICAALGHEDLATHRSLRRLACGLAAAGLPVLRYDHPGTGDSADLCGDEDWPGAVHGGLQHAADELKRRTGASRIALVGLRIGALLAALGAAQRDDVVALVALLPVPGGRAWMREVRLVTGAAPTAPFDAGGLVLDAAAAQGLSALAWPAQWVAVPEVLVIERDDLPSGGVAERLRQGGCRVEVQRLAELDRMTSVAHLAHVPQALFDQVRGWLVDRAAAQTAGMPGPADAGWAPPKTMPLPVRQDDGQAPSATVVHLRSLAGDGDAVAEELVCLRREPGWYGVLSRRAAWDGPVEGRSRRGLVLLSSGAERRVGPNRLWVPYARARASRGDVVLRIDLAGLGDSDVRPGGAEGDVYDPRGADDVVEAVAWLRREYGVGPCLVAGICSGAYHAWRGVLAQADCTTLVSINPLVFRWAPGTSLDPTAHAFGRIAVAEGALRAMRDPQRWLKLLRGQVNLRVIADAMAGRVRDGAARRWRGVARAAGRPLPDDVAADLLRGVQRGLRLCFVFSEGDPGRQLLAEQGGAVYRRLERRGQIEVRQLPGADHTLSLLAARQALWRQLDELIDRPAAGPSSRAGAP